MNSLQVNNRIRPCFNVPSLLESPFLHSCPKVVCVNAANSLKLVGSESPRRLQYSALVNHNTHEFVSKCRPQVTSFCYMSSGDNKGSPWKALQKAIWNFGKLHSVEDVLRQQMRNKEYYDEGSGKNPPPGGGKGGGGDGGNGSEGPENEDRSGVKKEIMQVILATLGFIFVYVNFISGEELLLLAKDCMKFLHRRKQSGRLKRVVDQWRSFIERLTLIMEYNKFWLKKALITTPTLYNSSEKDKRTLGAPVESDHGDNDNYNDEYPWQ